jgi:large subunit ribosomal protein L9
MKIILLKEIKGLGKKFDIKEVSDGYAKNFLIKNNFAKPASEGEVKELKIKKDSIEAEKEKLKKEIKDIAATIIKDEFIFYPKVGKNNEVFNSVNKNEIESAVLKKFPEKYREKIKVNLILKRPLKSLGEYIEDIEFNPPAGGWNTKAKIKILLKKSVA